ncbi:MAG TPA: hypothetical protein VL098_06745 [Flavipsychrobacter sp.]|nr:hypothetical protein [Flavipsychrobacter sp.]
MSTNEFDRVFKDRFDEHEFAYNPVHWEKLTRELPVERKRRALMPWLTGMAASVALLAGSYWFFHHASRHSQDVASGKQPVAPSSQPAPAVIHPSVPQPATSSNQHQPENIPAHEALKGMIPAPVTPAVATLSKAAKNTNTTHPAPSSEKQDENLYETPTKPSEKNLFPFIPNPVTLPNDKIAVTEPLEPAPATSITENLHNPIFFPSENDDPTKRDGKASISLAGGFNYGSLNAGYAASVNAKKKIGRKLFVEGDLGFMQNQQVVSSSMSTNGFNSVAGGGAAGRPAKLEEKPNDIYYFQLSPSLGYQLHERISIGAGVDMQKLLDGSASDRPVVATEDGFKMIPLWDAGITGRTEYNISKRVKAGILYREGINNMFSGDKRYFERRYLQIQMKLKLFGNK